MIKLKCSSCKLEYEVSEAELRDNGEIHAYCLNCGGKNIVTNLEEILELDIDRQIKANIKRWGNELGLEGMVELILRNQESAVGSLYMEELRKKGLVK
jgi:hypothetical protein